MRKNLQSRLKESQAITLIALVVTIVVLIILASVTISLTLGNNGLFNKAREAGQEYSNAQDYEEKSLSEYEKQVASIMGNRDNEETNMKNCTITISDNGVITVNGVSNIECMAISKDNKFIDITKDSTFQVYVPTNETASVYIIAIDTDMNLYKSNTVQYTGRYGYIASAAKTGSSCSVSYEYTAAQREKIIVDLYSCSSRNKNTLLQEK